MRTLARGNLSQWLCALLGSFALVVVPACLGFNEKGGETGPLTGEAASGPPEEKQELVVDEILVKFKPSVSQERIHALAEKHLTTIKEVITGIDWYVLKIQGGRSALEVVEALKREPEVEAVEAQGYMKIQ